VGTRRLHHAPAPSIGRSEVGAFLTKKDGHGFGLHRGVRAAKGTDGSLTAHSGGSGEGAMFALELSLDHEQNQPMNEGT
jgi:hypothetical protein